MPTWLISYKYNRRRNATYHWQPSFSYRRQTMIIPNQISTFKKAVSGSYETKVIISQLLSHVKNTRDCKRMKENEGK
jgi:hypothetical protein